jgi:pantoate--beta-alanine ligase
MARTPHVVRTVPTLRKSIAKWRRAGDKVALVPTMGALHEGHLSLVRLARRHARRVVVSIFVNPAQFAPSEDFESYPRTFARDLAALKALKVDLVWAPTISAMYPADFSTTVTPSGPAAIGLEDAFRPHFFGGVATVVTKLLLQVAPDVAVFGEKDFQQLRVVGRMARDLDIPVKIVPGRTVREKDGLAMSSRNAYLSESERERAPTLYRVLKGCAKKIKSGVAIAAVLAEGCAAIERAGFALDYLEARNAQTLRPITSGDEPLRLLVAAKIGTTRLIDNVAV